MKESEKKIGLLSFMGKNGIIFWIIAFALIGVVLISLGGGQKSKQNAQKSESVRLDEYTVALENKIAELCSRVRGAGSVNVSVYLDSGFETVYAYDEESKSTSSGTNSEKKYVTIGNGNDESMVSIVEKMPNICGVAVVCTGGGDPYVAKELVNLISSAYGVPANKIYVAEGKK